MIFLSWLVAKELTLKPGQFTPMGLFPSEFEANEYVGILQHSDQLNRNYIVKCMDSKEPDDRSTPSASLPSYFCNLLH